MKTAAVHSFIPKEALTDRFGLLQLKIGTYWAFKGAQYSHEDDDLTVFRLINERNYYKKWSYILAGATALACILAAIKL